MLYGHIFLQNEADQNVTVNGERYKAMIKDFFILELKDVDVSNIWFQQDRATYNTANVTINLLR